MLGYIVEEDGLRYSEKHSVIIRNLVEPALGDELVSFLGLLNFSTAFVDHFAGNSAPLYEFLKGKVVSKKK